MLNQKILHIWQEQNLYRQLKTVEHIKGNNVICDNHEVISFSSNNYLGLKDHPDIIAASKKTLDKYGVGSSASPAISGYTKLHVELTEKLAAFLHYDNVLLFSSGYMANLGAITTFTQKDTAMFLDKLCHASIIDGCRLANTKFRRYQHLNMKSLEKLLRNTEMADKLIISESVFSMDGDIIPLDELVLIANKFKAQIILDESHSIGVFGKTGRGCCEYFEQQPQIITGSFGKAFAGIGGFVAADSGTIDYLLQFGRTFTYATSLPPAIIAANIKALEIMQQENWRREKLQQLIKYFHQTAHQLNLTALPSTTPIQSILIHDAKKTMTITAQLLEQGFWVAGIRPPTVPPGSSRLRISLNCLHTEQQIKQLLTILAELINV